MTGVPATPPTEQIYGIAKRMNLELEKLPMHTHAGIVTMLRTMVEHRNIELQNEAQIEQIKANDAAMADARAKHAARAVEIEARDAKIAADLAHEAKKPRLVIEDVRQLDAGRPAGDDNPIYRGAGESTPVTVAPGQTVKEAYQATVEPTQPEAVLAQ